MFKNTKTIESSNSLLKKQLDSFFKKEKEDTKDLLYKISLIISEVILIYIR